MIKTCTKCNIEKPTSEFNKLSRSSDGLHSRCKECCRNYYNSLYPKIKENKIQLSKQRYKLKRDEILLYSKQRYDSQKKKEYNKIYNTANRLTLNKKKNEYEKQRIKHDPNYRLIKIMRKMVYRLIASKKDPTFVVLGYSKEQLIKWLGGVPKNNEAIDHRIPVSWFNPNTPISIISDYRNLQILDKKTNSEKSNLYSHPVQKEYYEIAINYIKNNQKPKIKYYEQ